MWDRLRDDWYATFPPTWVEAAKALLYIAAFAYGTSLIWTPFISWRITVIEMIALSAALALGVVATGVWALWRLTSRRIARGREAA